MKKEIIFSKDAPSAIGPYSQAVKCGRLIFISGQLPVNPETGQLLDGGLAEKTKQAMKNLSAVLTAAGADFSNLIKVTIYTTHMEGFKQINEAYAEFFKDSFPARAVVGVKDLPLGANVEIEAVASL